MADASDASRPTRPGQVVINVLANYGYFVIGMGVNFLLTPILNEQLTKPVFADWLLLVNIAIYFSLADLGLNNATVRHVAHAIGKGDLAGAGRVMAASRLMFGGIAAIFALAAATVWLIPTVIPAGALALKGITFETATTVLGFILLHWAMEMFFAPLNAALFGTQRYELARGASTIARALRGIAFAVLVFRGHGVVTLGLVVVAESVFKGLLQTWLLRRSMPALPIGFRGADRATCRAILGFSLWVVLWSLSGKLLMLSDNMIVQYTSEAALAPLMNAAMMPIIGMEQLLWAIAQVLVPYAAAGAARDDRAALTAAVTRAARFTLLLAAPMVTYVVVAGHGFIGAWMFDPTEFDRGLVAQAHDILIILAPSFLLMFLQMPAMAILVGSGRVRLPALINLCQAVAKVGLSIVLGLRHGPIGIAIGTAIPLVITNLFVLPIFVRRELDVGWGVLFAGAVGPMLRTAVLAAPITASALLLLDANAEAHWRLSHQLAFALGVAAVFGVAGWFLGLAAEDREWVTARVRRRRNAGG